MTVAVFFVLWIFGGGVAWAVESGGGTGFKIPNPLSCDTLGKCAENIIKDLLLLSVPIVTVMVVIGAYQILTAGGDPEKFKTGRKTIVYAAVGFAVLLLAQGVVYIVQDVLGGGGGCQGGTCESVCIDPEPAGPCPDGGGFQCVDGSWICP